MAISVKIAGTIYRCVDDYSITQQGAAVSTTRLNVLLGANPVPLVLQTAQILIDGTAFFLGLIQNVGTPEYSTAFETQVFSLSVASLECLLNMRLVTHNFYLSSSPTYSDVVQWIFTNIIAEEGITLGSISTTAKTYTSKWLITRQKAGDILNEICTKIGNAAWWISVDRKFYFKVSTDFTSVVAPTSLSALKLEEDIGSLRTTEIVTGASSKIVGTDTDATLAATIAARTGGSGKIEVVENDTTIHNPTKAGTEAELRLARNAESEKTLTCLCHDLTKSTLYNLWPLNLSINGVSIVGNFVVVERTISNLYSKTAASAVNIRVKLKNANYFAKYGYSLHDAVTISNDAMAEIADISNDDILSPSDKIRARDNWNIIASEKDALDDQADAYSITTEKASFDNAFTALANYLNGGTTWASGYPLWLADATLSETLEIVGTDFEGYWRAYYDARVALQTKITNSPLLTQYSINGSTSWHTPWVTGDLYMRQSSDGGTTWGDAVRIVGEAGTPGANGQFTDYRFAKNSSPTAAPAYTSAADNPGANWYDAPQTLAAGEFQWFIKSTWRDATRLTNWTPPARLSGEKGETGPQGPQGDQGTQGPTGADGATTYFHVAYATAADGSTGFNHSSGPYIGTYVDTTQGDSSDYHAYTWRQFVGSQGPQGNQGIPGTAGADGTVYYLHLAYATSADGSQGFSTSVTTGKTYLGTCVDTNATDPETYASYAWVKFEGPQGPQGIQGTQGVPGTSKYFHVRYSAASDGTGFNTTPNTYIGTAVTESETAPTDKAAYTWTQFKGDTGSQGIQGQTGANGTTYYLHIAYSTAADGSTGFSTSDPSGKTYLGQCVDTSATDPETPASYAWTKIEGPQGAQGPQGNQGTQGPTGANGATTYFHVAYATAADGSAGFNHSSGPYIGTYVDTTATDSEVYTAYAWRQFVGPTGAQGAQGNQGIQGVKGDDGTTYYLHIAYANSADGVTGFSTTDGSGKSYMGQCVDTTLADPTTPASYTWTLVKGADGANAIVMTSATTPSGTYDGQVGLWNSQLYTWSVSLGAWVNADATLPTDTPALYLSFDEVPDVPDDPAGVIYRNEAPWLNYTEYGSHYGTVTNSAAGQQILITVRARRTPANIGVGYPKFYIYNDAWTFVQAIDWSDNTGDVEQKTFAVTLPSTGVRIGWSAYHYPNAASGSSDFIDVYVGSGARLLPAIDNSKDGKHGTMSGCVPALGISGEAVYLCENDDIWGDIYLGTSDISIGFWMKGTVKPTGTYGAILVRLNDNGGARNWIGRFTPQGGWSPNVYFGGIYDFAYTDSNDYFDGVWHFFAGSFDRDGYAKWYVDGVLVGYAVLTGSETVPWNTEYHIEPNYKNVGPSVYYITATEIDEFFIIQRTLSPSEIRGLYLAKSLPKLYTMADYRLAEAADDGKITQAEKVSWAMPKWWDIYAATDVTSAMPSAPSVVGEYKTLRDAAAAVSIWTPTGAGTAAKAYYDAAEALRAYLFTTPGVLLTSSWAATITITKATWLGLWNTYKTTAQALAALTASTVAAADATAKANAAQSYADGLASALQSQIDGNITSWFLSGVPTLANSPASGWTTTALKDAHLGDLYYDIATGYAYRFMVSGGTYSWQKLSDSDIAAALAAASTAQATADGKTTLFATLALAQATGEIGDMFLDGSLLYRTTAAAASITLANSTRLTPKRYTDVANATARGALTGMILGDTVYQTDTLQWYVYTTSWVVDGPAMTTVAETYSPHYLGRSEAAHPAGHHPGDSWMVFDTDDSPIQRGIWYSNAGTPERITTSSSALLQAKMIQALPDVAWAEANGKGTSTDYGFNTFFEAIAAVTAFFNAMWAKEVTLVAAGWLKSHDYAVDGDGFPTAGFMLDVLNQSINSFGSIFTNCVIKNALITEAGFQGEITSEGIDTIKAVSATFTAPASYLGSAMMSVFNLAPSANFTIATGTFNGKNVVGIRNTGAVSKSLNGGPMWEIDYSSGATDGIIAGQTYTYQGSITVGQAARAVTAVSAGTFVLTSNTSPSVALTTSYTKRIEYTINRKGSVNIKMTISATFSDPGQAISSYTLYGRIYKNGAAYGTARSVAVSARSYDSELGIWSGGNDSNSWIEQVTGLIGGDKIQIYMYVSAVRTYAAQFGIMEVEIGEEGFSII